MICPFYTEPLFLFYVPDLPVLIYYSYVPAIVTALIVGAIILVSDRKNLLNRLLFGICVSFLVWTFSTLIAWTNIHSDVLLFTWSMLGTAAGFISIFSIYFAYVFVLKKDVGVKIKAIFAILLLPLIILAPTKYTLSGFNLTNCDAFGFEGLINTVYFPALGVLAMVWVLGIFVWYYRRSSANLRKQIVLMGTGLELFLFSFFTTEFMGQYLTTIGFLPDSQLETYGYFGMIIFIVYVSMLIARFKALHLNVIASQMLVIALMVLVGSQFAFVRNPTSLILVGVTLALTAISGFVLVRSVHREIKQRERIELLAQDLEDANDQQVILIHFITHQIKGFVAKSRNIFSLMIEGDYGVLPEPARVAAQTGFESDTKGAQTIAEILNAANIKNGKVAYTMEAFDLKATVEAIVNDLKPLAEAKGLTLITNLAPVTYTGDKGQLVNALKNLIDNSIKYTQKGTVGVTLAQADGKVRFEIVDTGVGIDADDMKNLFTEGGRGKNSQKINVESTGFGLYIVKNIVESHKGRVWAESEGTGKGSHFIVELPI